MLRLHAANHPITNTSPPPCIEEYGGAAPRKAHTICLPDPHGPHTPWPWTRLLMCLPAPRSQPPLCVLSALQGGPRPASYHPKGFYTGAKSPRGGRWGAVRGGGGLVDTHVTNMLPINCIFGQRYYCISSLVSSFGPWREQWKIRHITHNTLHITYVPLGFGGGGVGRESLHRRSAGFHVNKGGRHCRSADCFTNKAKRKSGILWFLAAVP